MRPSVQAKAPSGSCRHLTSTSHSVRPTASTSVHRQISVSPRSSHLSHAVCDSGLERKMCAVLDSDGVPVHSWVKNHRLYLEIPYLYFGTTYRYRPDFVVRLSNGLTLLLEGKGDPDEKDDAKATAARRWVEAVNTCAAWELAPSICYDAATLAGELSDLNELDNIDA